MALIGLVMATVASCGVSQADEAACRSGTEAIKSITASMSAFVAGNENRSSAAAEVTAGANQLIAAASKASSHRVKAALRGVAAVWSRAAGDMRSAAAKDPITRSNATAALFADQQALVQADDELSRQCAEVNQTG